MAIDPEGDIPVYVQLADLLRGQIDRGEIPERRPIPSKRQLVQEHGIAQGTVERALAVLKAEGYLKTVMGRGMYVVPAGERRPAG
jgi:DNA-binding GntR family transcriptional regulator